MVASSEATASGSASFSREVNNASILISSGHSSTKSIDYDSTARYRRKSPKDYDLRASCQSQSVSSSGMISVLPSSQSQQLPRHHWCKHWWNTNNPTSAPKSFQSSRAVWAGRILFVFVLISLAATFGILAYTLLTGDEANLAETQFKYISERALVEAKDALLARRWAGVTLANFVSELYPREEQWPLEVEWLGFEQVVRSMLNTSHGNDMGFVPFVRPAQLPEFEAFAKRTYQKLGFPNTTGVSKEFGFGVYGRNKTVTPPVKYHDTTAETPYNSPYEILAPIFRTDEGVHPVLLFNPHSQPFTGQAIDQMIKCSLKRREKYQDALDAEIQSTKDSVLTVPPNRCGVITDIFHNVKLGGKWSVANFLPIYPIQSPLTVVGYIPSIFIVHELLDNVFAKDISGIDAIFESDARSVSYTIVNGVAEYVGEGQHYDRKYSSQKQVIQLIDPALHTDGAEPKSFKFYLIPNDEFYEVYQTQNPMKASVAVVLSIILTILVFLLYDFFVRKEFHAKRELLEARRQFMRFVSHEVRTPLNAVSMGLDLMQSEVARALGYASATCYRASQEFDRENEGDTNLQRIEEGGISSGPTASEVGKLREGQKTAHGCNIPPEKAREWFQLTQEIQGNAQGAVDILNDLLQYDKIEQGKLNLGLEVLSVWHLLETAILEFKLPALNKQVNLSLTFAQEGEEDQKPACRAQDLPKDVRTLQVIGDSVRLTQVLRNLMSNALKFTNSGGSVLVEALYVPPLSLGPEQQIALHKGEYAVGSEAGQIKVVVTDTGAGMSSDQIDKLFQDGMQFNVNQLQKGGGSGLGLYIAKGIVKQHSGTLSATSAGLGQGTSFHLVLPLWKLKSDDAVTDEDAEFVSGESLMRTSTTSAVSMGDGPRVSTTRGSSRTIPKSLSSQFTRSLKILVVDDVKSNRKLLKRLLENNGHQCDEAEHGQQCLDMISNADSLGCQYECVLLDYEMPVMDGPTAARSIRERGISVNIVGITGNVLPDDVNFFLSCGANDVLAKPVQLPELYASWINYFASYQSDTLSELSASGDAIGYEYDG